MNKPPSDDAAARESISALRDLTNQIKMGKLTDEPGHDFRMNDAFFRAVELLARIDKDAAN